MIEFFLASANLPFGFALGLMFSIAFLEGVGAILGVGFSGILGQILPDIDIDLDAPDMGAGWSFTGLLGWLRVGEVPVLVLLIVFLTAFGIIGYGLQAFTHSILGSLLPGWFSSAVSLLVSLPVLRVSSGIIAKLIPKDETSAVSEATFVGRTATIVMGIARVDFPVQARLRDEHGRTHYVMVEPDIDGEEFAEGEEVLLVKREGLAFRVIGDTTSSLIS